MAASDFLKVVQEINGTGAPGADRDDGLYFDLVAKTTEDDGVTERIGAGVYGSVKAMYSTVVSDTSIVVSNTAIAVTQAEIATTKAEEAAASAVIATEKAAGVQGAVDQAGVNLLTIEAILEGADASLDTFLEVKNGLDLKADATQVLTDVPADALFTDTVYDATDVNTHMALENAHIDWTASSATAIHSDNYTNTTYPEVTATTGGILTDVQAVKFNGIEVGAQVNVAESYTQHEDITAARDRKSVV